MARTVLTDDKLQVTKHKILAAINCFESNNQKVSWLKIASFIGMSYGQLNSHRKYFSHLDSTEIDKAFYKLRDQNGDVHEKGNH